MIASEARSTAEPSIVHELLVDVDAWRVWSPHVASVDASSRRVTRGWRGATRAFFSPLATTMTVDDVRPAGGYTWHSRVGPWQLDYDNAVVPDGRGSTLRFSARLSGPASRTLERLVAPLSAYGQRRRLARLASLAELVERHTQ